MISSSKHPEVVASQSLLFRRTVSQRSENSPKTPQPPVAALGAPRPTSSRCWLSATDGLPLPSVLRCLPALPTPGRAAARPGPHRRPRLAAGVAASSTPRQRRCLVGGRHATRRSCPRTHGPCSHAALWVRVCVTRCRWFCHSSHVWCSCLATPPPSLPPRCSLVSPPASVSPALVLSSSYAPPRPHRL